MNNEQYLIVSYIIIAAVCILLATVAYLLLRSSFNSLAKTVFSEYLGGIMRKLFPLNILLFALAGFFSVSFRSCGKQNYESIIADKSYLIAKNHEQLETSLFYIMMALLLFGLLTSVGLAIFRNKRRENIQNLDR